MKGSTHKHDPHHADTVARRLFFITIAGVLAYVGVVIALIASAD